MTIGEKVLIERKKKGLRQEDLAAEIGVSTRTINVYENGVSKPRKNTARKLSEFFGKPEDYFFEDDNGEEKESPSEKFWLDEAEEKFGPDAVAELKYMVEMQTGLFAGGSLPEEDRELFYESLMKSYIAARTAYESEE